MTKERLEFEVNEALDIALENGYDQSVMTAMEITTDLLDYDCTFADVTKEDLFTAVKSVLEKRKS